jgi:hypothetical protein
MTANNALTDVWDVTPYRLQLIDDLKDTTSIFKVEGPPKTLINLNFYQT